MPPNFDLPQAVGGALAPGIAPFSPAALFDDRLHPLRRKTAGKLDMACKKVLARPGRWITPCPVLFFWQLVFLYERGTR